MKHIENNYIALGISAILLLVALINGLPYGYFTFMRIVACLSTAYMAWTLYEDNDTVWVWIFAAMAILFNPIFLIHFDREVWVWFDGIIGVFLIGFIYFKNNK